MKGKVESGVNANLFDIAGRIAIVTGAGRGLGRVMVEALARQGAKTAIVDKDEAAAWQVAATLREQGLEATGIECDVSSAVSVDSMVDEVQGRWGCIDILINNAGINLRKPIIELQPEDFEKVNRVNLIGTFLCSRSVFPIMKSRSYGKIVNIASLAGMRILRGTEMSPYNTSKTAVLSFTRAAAAEWAPFGITVNAISPGWFVTDFNRHLWDDPVTAGIRLEQTPMGRVGDPQELCGTILYLTSRASDYVTGQNIAVDGGYSVW